MLVLIITRVRAGLVTRENAHLEQVVLKFIGGFERDLLLSSYVIVNICFRPII